jgi:tellurite resistance protein TehA-like permease
MGAGFLIAAIGMALFARHVHSISDNRNVRIASYVLVAMAVVGALFLAIVCYNRIALPSQEVVANLDSPDWKSFIYYLFLEIALIMIGFLLLLAGYSKWFAWLMLVLAGLILVGGLALGGLPPAVYSLSFLILGIGLLLMRSRAPQPSFKPA